MSSQQSLLVLSARALVKASLAAYLISGGARYASHAREHLKAWFSDYLDWLTSQPARSPPFALGGRPLR